MNNDLLSILALGILLTGCLFSRELIKRLVIYWVSLFLVTNMVELTANPIDKVYDNTPTTELRFVMAKNDDNCDDDDDKNPCK
ncbi:membrane protein [Beggiatoa sp. PS]|nr:membrane protein [Beggiatoa sp. PS]